MSYQITEQSEVNASFIDCFYDGDEHTFHRAVDSDRSMVAEDFNNYTDSLCSDGVISEEFYESLEQIC